MADRIYPEYDRGPEAHRHRSGDLDLGWGDYTPVLTAATTDPTLGTGSSATGRYVRIGNLVIVQVEIVFGSSGVSAGSGTFLISSPVNIAGNFTATSMPLGGQGVVVDSSPSTVRHCAVERQAADQFAMRVHDATGRVTDASPWTWAANDSLRFTTIYEAAQ